MLKMFLGKTIRALQTILVLVISFFFQESKVLASQISKNQSGKEYIIQGQLSIFLHKISLRSVENYFT